MHRCSVRRTMEGVMSVLPREDFFRTQPPFCFSTITFCFPAHGQAVVTRVFPPPPPPARAHAFHFHRAQGSALPLLVGFHRRNPVTAVRHELPLNTRARSELLDSIPLESNLDLVGAISFSKGCYVGQELTVRTQFKVCSGAPRFKSVS